MDTHFRQNLVSHEEDISSQHYCLRWNNYQTNMTSVFHQLLKNEAFVDVTLVCKELSLKAHKVVLSACSSFFQKLLMDNPCNHPTIIMPQDICYNDLKFIIEFVYKGEIDVSQEELQSLLKTADQLKIKGLCDLPGENENDRNTPNNSYYALNDESPVVPTGLRKSYSKICRLSGSSTKRSHRNITDIPAKRYFKETATNRDIYSTEKSDRVIKTEKTNYNSLESAAENEDINMPVVLLESKDKSQGVSEEREVWSPSGTSDNHPVNMTGHGLIPAQNLFPGHVELPPEPPAPAATPVPCSPQELMQSSHLSHCSPTTHHDLSESNMSTGSCAGGMGSENDIKIKFETLRSVESMDACSRASSHASGLDNGEEHPISSHSMHMMITPELLGLIPSGSDLADDPLGSNGIKSSNGHSSSDGISRSHMNNGVMGNLSNSGGTGHGGGPKTWSQEDMELALDALRNHNMSLTKASATYGIPSTTLWQRAHRLGIDTPKKEGPTKSWTEESLNSALEALRTGTISANKASKAYGIPSSTLYKIARREGIRLAAPFNAAPTTWSPEDLERALESIRTGQTSVQKASAEFGIPTGTLYGRCKREGIELSRSNPTPWSEDAMGEALEAVRVGQMSINQAAIHYNLPYSSLYGRFKRGKYDTDTSSGNIDTHSSNDQNSSSAIQEHSMSQYPNTSSSSQNHTHVHSMSSSQSHMSGSHLNMTNNQYQHQNIS